MQRNLAGHGQVVAHRDTGQRRHQGRGQGDARTGTILGHGALGGVDVQVGVLELISGDAVFLGVDLGVGHGQLGALLHDVAQAAGNFNFAAAVRYDGDLNGEHLAADAGPG